MNLKDVFDTLAFGELRQLFIQGDVEPTSTIPEANRMQVYNSVWLALTDLHKRFLLREKRFELELVTDQQVYLLNKLFAQSNSASTQPVKYINDSEYPFLDDLLKIERVIDEDGSDMPLNDLDATNSVRTITYNTLLLPDDLEDTALTVVYRADHPPVTTYLITKAPQLIPIELPPSHLEALTLYVASRVINPIGLTKEFHEGNNYYAKYLAACALLEQKGYQVDTTGKGSKIRDSGWI